MNTLYTPSSVVNCYSNAVKVDIESNIITMQGIYKPDSHNKLYSEYYYDRLVEQDNSSDIIIRVKPYLRQYLQDNKNKLITLTGYLSRKITKSCCIDLSLTVSGICKTETNNISDEEKVFWEIQRNKSQSGRKDIGLILRSELMAMKKPKIALVWAFSSCTKTEFYNALGNANLAIHFDEYSANFGNVSEIIGVLKRLDNNYQAIALVRGGGSGLEVFNDNSLLSYLISMRTPVISAIGHAEEKHNLKLVADLVIDTPTALGKFFSDIVEVVSSERENSKAVLIESIKKQFIAQLDTQNKQIEDLQKRLSVAASDKQQSLSTYNSHIQNMQKQITEMSLATKNKDAYIRERELAYSADINKLNQVHAQQVAASTKHIEELQMRLKQSESNIQDEIKRVTSVYQLQNASLSSQLKSISSDLQQKVVELDHLRAQHNNNVSLAVLITVSLSAFLTGMLLVSLF